MVTIFTTTVNTRFMNLWDLPTDLLDLVLAHLSIEDYVHLLHTSKRLRLLLNSNHHYQIIWKANFSEVLEAYEFPYNEAEHTDTSVFELFALIREIETVLENIQKAMECLKESEAVSDVSARLLSWRQIDSFLNQVFSRFAIDKKFFIPVVFVAMKYWREFCVATECSQGTYNISRMCWSRQLLHLQNVNLAVEFLRSSLHDDTDDMERFLFEMSRFDYSFPELSKVRMVQIKKLRNHARRIIPIPGGTLVFPSERHFLSFIGSLANKLSADIERRPQRNRYDQSTGINVLREYHGQNAEPAMFRVAILAKILQEEVFGKLRFQIGSEVHTFTPKISQQLIMFGKYRLRLRTNSTGFAVESGPQPGPLERLMTMRMDFGKALALCTTFKIPVNHVDEYLDRITFSDVPEISIDKEYWLHSMKFMETLLNGNKIRHSDLVERDLVFFVGMVPFKGTLNFQWAKYIVDKLACGPSNLFQEEGQLVFDKRRDKYGVIAQSNNGTGSTFLAYAHTGKVQTMDASDVEILGRISPRAAQGLMTSLGFTVMGMFYASQMRVDDGEYRFIARSQKSVE